MEHSVRIDGTLGQRIEEIAENEGVSVSDFYVMAARKELKRRRREAFAEIDEMIGEVEVDREKADREIERLRGDRQE